MALGRYLMIGGGAAAAYVAVPNVPATLGPSFAVPLVTARTLLATEPDRLVEGSGMGSLTVSYAGVDANVVSVSVKRAGEPRPAVCRVTLTPPSPETTSAAIDCHQPGVAVTPIVRVAEQAVSIVVKEHVAATLDRRAYDTDAIAARMIALAVVSRPAIAASIQEELPDRAP